MDPVIIPVRNDELALFRVERLERRIEAQLDVWKGLRMVQQLLVEKPAINRIDALPECAVGLRPGLFPQRMHHPSPHRNNRLQDFLLQPNHPQGTQATHRECQINRSVAFNGCSLADILTTLKYLHMIATIGKVQGGKAAHKSTTDDSHSLLFHYGHF